MLENIKHATIKICNVYHVFKLLSIEWDTSALLGHTARVTRELGQTQAISVCGLGLGVSCLPPQFPPLQVSALWKARLSKNSRRNISFLATGENIVLMFILPLTLVPYINYTEKTAVSSNRQWAHLSCIFLKWYHKNKSTPSKTAYKEQIFSHSERGHSYLQVDDITPSIFPVSALLSMLLQALFNLDPFFNVSFDSSVSIFLNALFLKVSLHFLKPLECFKRNIELFRLPLCVCVFKPNALPVNKCRIVYSMALPPFRLKQSTWCYWFQRIFRDWQLESLHRSVTEFPRKLEKWYSKWGRKESRCHPPKG